MNKLFYFFVSALLLAVFVKSIRAYPTNSQSNSQISTQHLNAKQLNENGLFEFVQDWRRNNGYNVYIKDNELCRYAYSRLYDIQNEFSHNKFHETSPISLSKTFKENGENLSKGYISERATLQAWINSPSHLENLQADYTYSCVACKETYCVQIFGNKR